MTLRQGILTHIERDRRDVSGVAPRRVYLQDHATVVGRYVLGDTAVDATAWLRADPIASAAQRIVLDDDATTETHVLYLIADNRVIVWEL